jgi:hypothetical protein
MARQAISSKLKDELLIECGYKCSMPRCEITDSLEFHHINGKNDDNRKENIIVLCAVHHHQATIKKISKKACSIMKQMLPNLDGMSLSKFNETLFLSEEEFGGFLDIAREISRNSLRIITREFVSYLLGKNEGYSCRPGIPEHDYLVEKQFLFEVKNKKSVPPTWKITERGILFCRFLYNSQYFMPFIAFDKNYPRSVIIKWNFEKMPF